jgi:lipopolysaccharide transport system permease protein
MVELAQASSFVLRRPPGWEQEMIERPSASLLIYARSLRRHSDLISQLVRREFAQRYRGSVLGALWAFVTPLIMVMVYTFVFTVVFPTRWGAAEAAETNFVVIYLVGALIHGLFAEAVGRAPHLIVGQANYVKKVVFPLEILPIVVVAGALITAAIGFAIAVLLNLILAHTVQWTAIFLPVILIPYLLLLLGMVLLISALGVYLRDLGQAMGVIITLMLFLTPVFYPITAVPERFRTYIYLNPLTFIVEQAREVTLFGHLPNWSLLAVYTVCSLAFCWFGLFVFQRARGGFADVL